MNTYTSLSKRQRYLNGHVKRRWTCPKDTESVSKFKPRVSGRSSTSVVWLCDGVFVCQWRRFVGAKDNPVGMVIPEEEEEEE
ncbi:hypothetical protein M0802_008109 [Mischocyttarus mexicanus]|nr:hypothetical protein M0802_008109 [Mischocyttarus mexicanus]